MSSELPPRRTRASSAGGLTPVRVTIDDDSRHPLTQLGDWMLTQQQRRAPRVRAVIILVDEAEPDLPKLVSSCAADETVSLCRVLGDGLANEIAARLLGPRKGGQ